MIMERKLITKRDLIILAALFLFAAAFLIILKLGAPSSSLVAVVSVNGNTVSEIPLSNVSQTQIVTLENGVKLKLENKTICFFKSDCKDKICIKSGVLSRSGDVAACVPEKTVVRVEGSSNDIDVITY